MIFEQDESRLRSMARQARARARWRAVLRPNLGYVYVDTGAMYRAVALWALRANVALSDMHRLEQLANAAHIEFAAGRGFPSC